MSELTIEVKRFDKKDSHAFMGGDNSNPSWEEYMSDYKEEFHPHLILIKEAIEKEGLIGMTGEQMQNEGISFAFSDGQHWSYTWRAWGDLMQAVVNKKEGYMTYYM